MSIQVLDHREERFRRIGIGEHHRPDEGTHALVVIIVWTAGQRRINLATA